MKHFCSYLFITLISTSTIFAQSSGLDNLKIIQKYLVNSGMDARDIESLSIQTQSFSKSMNVDNIYVVQEYLKIPIKNAIGSFALRDGKVVSFHGNYISDIKEKIKATASSLSPETAVRKAAEALELGAVNDVTVIQKNQNTNSFMLSKGNISLDDIPVSLVYELKDNTLILSWDLSIHTKDGKNWYSVRVDANSGSLISKSNWILNCSFENHTHSNEQNSNNTVSILKKKLETSSPILMDPVYNVLPIPAVESPNHGSRQIVSGQEDAIASPFGWHDTNGVAGAESTTTTGNNVFASEDLNGNNGAGNQPDGGANLVFDFPFDPDAAVAVYQNASITNLFYANNVIHDVWYQYGFDEAAGNFQFNNYGNGGSDNDEVIADAQDGSSVNNATFGTPPDGFNPRMSMFLWNPNTIEFLINNTSLSGSFNVLNNSFDPGKVDPPLLPNNITADLVLAIDDDATVDANDICTDLINGAELAGKIAVVRRGECNFTAKVVTCQLAGALAVLVVNNIPGDIAMGGGDGTITIPALSINQADGETIITEMSTSTINATLGIRQPQDFTAAADGSFDNGIVIHEYGHGISTRLTGGAGNSGCLSGDEQMGEGWSDWFALMMTIEAGDTGADARGIGTYAVEQPITGGGIRPFPYSTNTATNPVTYASISDAASFSIPHGVGSVWASILWDMTWAFIERDGFDPDLYNGTGGNNLAMQLVIDGLKLQSCNPGFVDGRDGILAAADLLENSELNKCIIWNVFAARGVGFSADQGLSQSRADQVEAFDLPPVSELNCNVLGIDDNIKGGVFKIYPNPSKGTFDIEVAESIGSSKILMFDMNGRVVYEENTQINSSHRVNVNLGSGIYVLRIEGDNGTEITTTRIAIE